jgi:ribonuclease VapC
MVIDTSAFIAILMDEPERDLFNDILASETILAMSAVTYYEASVVMAGKKQTPNAARLVDDLVAEAKVDVIISTIDEAIAAREAYFRYGRGYHPAGLNLADCFAYALAKSRNESLLFKGEDFSKTDIVPAWRPQNK